MQTRKKFWFLPAVGIGLVLGGSGLISSVCFNWIIYPTTLLVLSIGGVLICSPILFVRKHKEWRSLFAWPVGVVVGIIMVVLTTFLAVLLSILIPLDVLRLLC